MPDFIPQPPNNSWERLRVLRDHGFVEHDPANDGCESWCFTEAGLTALDTCWRLRRPLRVCAIRDGLLTDMTDFELLLCLRSDGWTWGRWLSAAQRQKKGVPSSYEVGSPKVWYSSGLSACRSYLLCLLMAEVSVNKNSSMLQKAHTHTHDCPRGRADCQGGLPSFPANELSNTTLDFSISSNLGF